MTGLPDIRSMDERRDPTRLREQFMADVYRAGCVGPGSMVIDLGACVGEFSIWAAQRGAWVLAVEPEPKNVAQLERNVRRCGVEARVAVEEAAVGPSPGVCELRHSSGDYSLGGFTRPGQGATRMVPLADLLERWDRVDVLKVDVEGAEYDAFATCPSDLLDRVGYLTMEFHAWQPPGGANPAVGLRDADVPWPPGGLALIVERLEATHDLEIAGEPDEGGYLYAWNRERWASQPPGAGMTIDAWLEALALDLTGFDEEPTDARQRGLDWPERAVTMIGMHRLRHLMDCVRQLQEEGVPGDLAECGVWRGGACIAMKGVLAALGDDTRQLWVADSFCGLPPPEERYPLDAGDRHWSFDELRIPEAEVRANFERYGLLDERVRFLPGWFRDSLPGAPIGSLALLRMDGDMYSSTMDTLRPLYPRLSSGAFVIADDYGGRGQRAAVDDYRAEFAITAPICPCPGHPEGDFGAWWRKP